MSKAEERAREYANTFRPEKTSREDYLAGYKQAEKDLALTWEDIHRLAIIEDNLIHELCIKDDTIPTTQSFYEEALTRFKQFKEAKK